MSIPDDLKYTKTHEWVREEDGQLVVGITDFAQQELTDITFVELPEEGADFDSEAEIAVVESTKHASDIYCPVAGTVTAVNSDLEETPETINTDPYGNGWLFKLTPTDPSDLAMLLDPDAYREIAPE